MKRNGKQSISVQDLVKGAFLAAISIVLTRLFSFDYLEIIRVGFGNIPIMISGLLFGPFVGGITGAVADIVGVLISARGTPHLGFTLTSALSGIIPGIFAIYFRKYPRDGRQFTFPRILVSVFSIVMGSSLVLNSLWLSQLHGTPFMVLLKTRAISGMIMLITHSLITYNIIKTLNKNMRV